LDHRDHRWGAGAAISAEDDRVTLESLLHPHWPNTIEAFVSLIGAAALLAYLRVLLAQKSRSLLELRQIWLLGAASAFLFVRSFFWTTGLPLFGALTFFTASSSIFLIFLYAEGLLERHMPLSAKLYALLGSAFFAIASLSGNFAKDVKWMAAFGIYFLGLNFWTGAILATRKKDDLSDGANSDIRAIIVAVALSTPFFLTDLLADLSWNVPRLGTLGALTFLYMFLRAARTQDTICSVMMEISRVLVTAAGFAWIQQFSQSETDLHRMALSFSLYASLILLIRTLHQLREIGTGNREQLFLNRINHADLGSPERFVSSLLEGTLIRRLRIIREPEMSNYDRSLIRKAFERSPTSILTLSGLKREISKMRKSGKKDELFVLEQISDLIEKNGMSHAARIESEPLVLLLADIPQAGRERSAHLELGLVCRIAGLTEKSRGNVSIHEEVS
jgi:hypothetical protein